MSGHFWRIWAVLLVLSIFWLGWCMKTSQPAKAQNGVAEVVSAKKFQVVDDEGNTRAMLGMLSDGSPMLGLFDAQGNPYAYLEAWDRYPSLWLYDEEGNISVWLSGEKGSPHLNFSSSGSRGIPRVEIGVRGDEEPYIYFWDAQGSPSAWIKMDAEGTPSLALFDAQGEVLIGAGTRLYPWSEWGWGMLVLDPDGHVLYSAPYGTSLRPIL